MCRIGIAVAKEDDNLKYAAAAFKVLLWALIQNREDPDGARKLREVRGKALLDYFGGYHH